MVLVIRGTQRRRQLARRAWRGRSGAHRAHTRDLLLTSGQWPPPSSSSAAWGRIIGIQSTSVKQPVENIDLSNGIRPGIAGLMKAIMPGLARDGITINLVLPGMFRTSRILGLLPGDTEEEIELTGGHE